MAKINVANTEISLYTVNQDYYKKGNIRDYANVSQLVCLANLENLNALFINDGLPQEIRLDQIE